MNNYANISKERLYALFCEGALGGRSGGITKIIQG